MQQHLGGEENYDDETQAVDMLKHMSVNSRMGKPTDPMSMCKLNCCVQQIDYSEMHFWAMASLRFKQITRYCLYNAYACKQNCRQ